MQMPAPRSKKELTSLNGLCNYLANFIPHCATFLTPITRLTKKNVVFRWGESQRRALDIIREILSKDLMLEGIDYDYPLYIRTDASDKGMGVVLIQIINGREKVVAYASMKFKDSELHWSAIEKECRAVLFGLKRFCEFFGGQKIICYSDNKALTYLKENHPNNKNLTRWSHQIEGYNCEIQYYEGKKNILADLLSRFPVDNSVDEPDQLEDCPEKSYVPCFAITYFSNVLEKIKAEQRNDAEIQQIIETLKSNLGAEETVQQYVMKDEILYRCVLPFRGSFNEMDNDRQTKECVNNSDLLQKDKSGCIEVELTLSA